MKKTILVIDDSLSIRNLLKMTLEQANYQVLLACDGQDGLHFLDGSEIHMILVDLYMPQLDGISFTKKARTLDHYQNTPIILLTTESLIEKKKAGKAAGANGWLLKPFPPEKLLAIVQQLIQ